MKGAEDTDRGRLLESLATGEESLTSAPLTLAMKMYSASSAMKKMK